MTYYVVETYEFGKHIATDDVYFSNPQTALNKVDALRTYNKINHINGFKYKIMIEER